MHCRSLSTLVLLALANSTQAQNSQVAAAQWSASYVPGEILVLAAPGRELEVSGGFGSLGLSFLQQDAESGLMRVGVPFGQELAWIQILNTWPALNYAELNGIGGGGLVPDDTHYASQWHLSNAGQTGGSAGADVEAQAAWNITTGSASIVVAVLDTGIDSDHPDFAGRIDPDGMDFVNGDNDPEADHPHGTWVSGSLGANANNGFGTLGVDWNCRILPIKVLDAGNRGTTFALAQGLNYTARQADVQVINMSLINYPPSSSVNNAMTRARNAGQILMACAGNGGPGNANVSYPGNSPLTISVGATDSTDARAGFSGTGTRLDFVAPGDAIATTRHNSASDAFSVVSGCSFATPIASGVVSLLLALAEQQAVLLDQDQVYELLRQGAEDQVGTSAEDTPGRDNFHGHGRINALRTLQALPFVLPLDIKPGYCPNRLYADSFGKLNMALLGTGTMDISMLDTSSVKLSRADGIGTPVAPIQGPDGPAFLVEDIGSPFQGDACDCHFFGGDHLPDLSMKFSTDEVIEALELDQLPHGTEIDLVVSGTLRTGQTFTSSDCITMLPQRRKGSRR